METPAVSVVIPVWNSGQYFRECLDSVVGQTLRNIEILIVDDASTDGSGAVADEYATRDDRITVVHQKKSTGAGPARNVAMAMAKGEYIAFMDSDDLYPSTDVLEVLYAKSIENKANICGGSLIYINKDGSIRKKQLKQQIFKYEQWYEYKNYQYEGGFYRFLYKKNFLNENKIEFPNYKRFQDSVFFVKSMVLSKNFYVINKNTYKYRKGHKYINWTNDKIIDHLIGVKTVLDIAYKNNFFKLYYNMVKNIYIIIDFCVYKESLKCVYKVFSNINFHIINEKNRYEKVKLYKIKFIYKLIKMFFIVYNGKITHKTSV